MSGGPEPILVGSTLPGSRLRRFVAPTPLKSYVLRRLALIPVALWAITTLTFLMVNAIPSSPELVIAGPIATDEMLAEIRGELGLDQSLWTRYWDFLGGVVTDFDFGESYFSNRPVGEIIVDTMPSSLLLVFLSLIVAFVIGTGLGTLGAYFRGRTLDHISRGLSTATQVTPNFLLGLVLIYVVFFRLRWLPPPVGQLSVVDIAPPEITGAALIDALIARDGALVWSAVRHALLPVLTLGISTAAFFAKATRTTVSRALMSHQVEFARANGLPSRQVFGYAFLVARTQLMTYGGVLFAVLVGGAVIIEEVFSWGGIGQRNIDAILQLDLPVIQGITLALSTLTLLMFILIDIVVALLDPRISYE